MSEMATTPAFFGSVRFLVTVMAFFGYCLQYMLKINLGIAIVCMVNHTALNNLKSNQIFSESITLNNNSLIELTTVNTNTDGNGSFSDNVDEVICLFKEDNSQNKEGEFAWSKEVQGFVLASYFYGYIITQVPGGWLSAKYGGRKVIVVSNLVASFLTITAPWFARYHYLALSFIRFLIGLAHGAFWPAMSAIFVYWAPAKDRTKMLGSSTSGAWMGNIIALPLGGFLCVYGFDGGWASIFYIFGLFGMVWSVVFWIVITDSPKTHWFISEEEKTYIVEATVNETSARERGPLKTPWGQIFKSKVCWATFIAHFCNNWGNYMFLTQLPSFMKDVLKFNIKTNGTMSAIPYVACALVTVTFGVVSDKLIRSNTLTRTNSRRLFNTLGLGMPMVAIFCLSFVDCSIPYVGVVCLTVAMAFNGFYWCGGPLVNINDIAGSFSGIIFGIANSFGTAPGIICPYFVGFMTKNQTQKEWQVVFIVAAGVYLVGTVVFLIFGNSDLQSWAYYKKANPVTDKSSQNQNDE